MNQTFTFGLYDKKHDYLYGEYLCLI